MDYAPLKEPDNPDDALSSSMEAGEINHSFSTESMNSESKTNKRNIRSLTKSGSNLEEPLTGPDSNGHHFEIGDPNETDYHNGDYSVPQQVGNGTGQTTSETVADDDPYYVFKDDFLRKLEMIDECLASYKRVVLNTDTAVNTYEVKDGKKQLKRHLKHAESTLKDLQTTIRLVEKQRQKFPNISDAEFYERQSFVASSQNRLSSIKQAMNADELKQKFANDEHNLAVRRAGGQSNNQSDLEKENTAFLVNQSTQAQLMLRQQDETLDDLDDAVMRVGNMADGIHEEINNQNKMLDELDDDLQNAEEQLGFVMGKLSKFLKTQNKCQLGTILTLCLIVLILFFLVVSGFTP